MDEKALLGLTGILRTTRKSFAGRMFLNLEAFAPSSEWEFISKDAREGVLPGGSMTYSFTQISQYLRCPRQYRYRYLDGWREKEDKASMMFGRCFETALAAYFAREDATAAFFQEWRKYQDASLAYVKNDSWDRLYHQGIHLLERFAQDDRVRIERPKQNLQVKLTRSLPCGGDFVSYIDAIGEVDGTNCIIDWKTTTSRYAEQPEGLLALDPQLICYSWMAGISDVALVVFVRKNAPEIQYLKTSIDEAAAPGVWPAGGDHGQSDRSGPIPSAQRNPFPAEWLCKLPTSGDLPGGPAADGFQTHSPAGSERP